MSPTRAPATARLGTWGGVPVLVSASCAVVVALLAVAVAPWARRVEPELEAGAYAVGAAVGVLVYLAALLHESAHAVAARRYGHRVRSITLGATGGRTVVDGEARTPREEAATAAVGPLLSLAVGAAALAGRAVVGDGLVGLALEMLVLANVVLGLLDLVPAPPLDGGRVVKAIAWRLTGSPRRGAIAAAWCGRVVAVLLLGAPLLAPRLFGSDVSLTFAVVCGALAVLLWLAARQEIAVNRLRLRLAGVRVRDLARPLPADVPPPDGLPRLPVDVDGDGLLVAVNRTDAVEYLLVDAEGRGVGVVSLHDVDRVVRAR